MSSELDLSSLSSFNSRGNVLRPFTELNGRIITVSEPVSRQDDFIIRSLRQLVNLEALHEEMQRYDSFHFQNGIPVIRETTTTNPPKEDVEPQIIDCVNCKSSMFEDDCFCSGKICKHTGYVKLMCGHIFHGTCIEKWGRNCPMCRGEIITEEIIVGVPFKEKKKREKKEPWRFQNSRNRKRQFFVKQQQI